MTTENIFNGCELGSKFKTRDGRIAILIEKKDVGVHYIIEGEHAVQFQYYEQDYERDIDIVDKYDNNKENSPKELSDDFYIKLIRKMRGYCWNVSSNVDLAQQLKYDFENLQKVFTKKS